VPLEALGTPETDPYLALERTACQRWFDAIPSLPKSTFAVQIDGAGSGPSPGRLHEALVKRLGSGHVVRIPVAFVSPEAPGPLRDYYKRIDQRIRRQMAAQRLSFDPATAKAAIWGQSFEGCASGFGSAVANSLGLKTPTRFDYPMSPMPAQGGSDGASSIEPQGRTATIEASPVLGNRLLKSQERSAWTKRCIGGCFWRRPPPRR
jgi:hypothetical protein